MKFAIFQAFVSEYAVTGKDAGTGSLLAALAEAGFLIGLEKNRFVIVVPALLRCYQCASQCSRCKVLMPSPFLFLLERVMENLERKYYKQRVQKILRSPFMMVLVQIFMPWTKSLFFFVCFYT